MKKVKVLKPLNKLIFFVASSNLFNIIMDFIELIILHNDYLEVNTYYEKNSKRYYENLEALYDGKSKMVYQNIVLYRRTHMRKYMKGIVDDSQYFDKEIIKLEDAECFVDCGAYTGDTISVLDKKLSGKEYSVIAFEPDDYNFGVLLKKVNRKYAGRNIEIHHEGTWSEQTTLHFQNDMDDSSRVSDNGEVEIPVDSIDNVVGDRRVTFIKMDVEGAELESLMGARKCIAQNHPRLAISIYHSDEDMIDIIEWIHKEFPFYRLYVRHYTWLFTDSVCYAVDPDRYDTL